MSLNLKPGNRLYSTVCTTEMVVVKAPPGPVELTIGGAEPSTAAGAERHGGAVAEGHGGGSALGKRFTDEQGSIELLCTKAGDGVAAIDGVVLRLRDARQLPASD